MHRAALVLSLLAACSNGDGTPAPAPSASPSAPERARPPAIADTALATGATAPDIDLPATTGRWALAAVLAQKERAVVVFYRGDWCPFCRAQLDELGGALPSLDALGAGLVAISVDPPEVSEKLVARLGLPFSLASDEGGAVMKQFGVFDPENEIAWPSIWVIERDRRIAWRWLADSYDLRVPAAEVVRAVEAVRQATSPSP